MPKTWFVVILLAAGVAAGCGGGKKATETSADGSPTQAACDGKALSEALKLPASFPQIEPDKLTYTQQSTKGPTEVVEGYFNGSVQEAHGEFQKELRASGYTILFDEVEAPHDSEISWKGEGRTGLIAMRQECGTSDKTYVRITNRSA
jgi:hypothetical protein